MLTALYRHFSASGELLYVGISLSVVQRLSDHMGGSHWANSIARVTVEWLPSREDALIAETQAIITERPKHNVVHNRGERSTPPRPTKAPAPVHEWVHTLEEVAVYYKVSKEYVRKMMKNGMPFERMSERKCRFDLLAIKAWSRKNAEIHIAERNAKRKLDQQESMRVMREAMEKAFK